MNDKLETDLIFGKLGAFRGPPLDRQGTVVHMGLQLIFRVKMMPTQQMALTGGQKGQAISYTADGHSKCLGYGQLAQDN